MVGRFTRSRLFADPEKAARRLLEHARAFEPARHGWIDIEQLKHPFLFADKAMPSEFRAAMEFALSQGWLELHESGTFVKLMQAGTDLVAVGTKTSSGT
jgi:hypothetical protein